MKGPEGGLWVLTNGKRCGDHYDTDLGVFKRDEVRHDPRPVDDQDHDRKPGTIRTITGRYVSVTNPDPADIELHDIAWALSHLPRYNAHTLTPYTVAEHCMHVAAQVLRTHGDYNLALSALLHDATEAYVGDMPTPLKDELPRYRQIEDTFAEAIESRFELIRSLDHPDIKTVDTGIVPWEMAMIRDSTFRVPPPAHALFVSYQARFTIYQARAENPDTPIEPELPVAYRGGNYL